MNITYILLHGNDVTVKFMRKFFEKFLLERNVVDASSGAKFNSHNSHNSKHTVSSFSTLYKIQVST